MDEQSLGLSPKLIRQLMGHLQVLNREFGKTILIVEQKIREVLEICDYVYAIKMGPIAYSGPPKDLKIDTDKLRQIFL